MTTAQRILQIEAELAGLKADLAKEAPTLARQSHVFVDTDGKWTVASNCSTREPAKDWEILEYITTEMHNEPGVKIPTNTMEPCWKYHYDCAYKQGWVSIYSVRRLFDNTIWNLGKRANCGVIESFEISHEGHMWVNAPGYHILFSSLLDATHLYTAADGVKLYDTNQKVYSLSISGANYTGYISEGPAGCIADWKRAYSTRLAAEKAYNEWLADQPVLSLNDIRYYIDIGPYCELEALVKDKIAK